MKNIFKDKKKTTIIITIISILLVGSAIATSTYALFYDEKVAANPNEYSTGLLSIEALSKTDTISLNNSLPIEDSEGLETDPYVFTIRNNGNLDYTFDVKLLSTSSNTINPNYIKLKIDDSEVTTLSSLTNSKIKSNLTLKAKESIDISIRIWLAINTPNTEIGKEFTSKLVIDGQAVYTENDNMANIIGEIYTLFDSNSTVTNNNITYEIDTNNNLIKDIDGNIRYYGANPNNYIYFNCDEYPDTNCEIWRIIGIIDGKLRIMRGESIGTYSWDNSVLEINSGLGVNEWSQASAMKLLNPGYDDNKDLDSEKNQITVNNSLYYNRSSGICYTGSKNATDQCDFTDTGLKNEQTKSKIISITWKTAGFPSSEIFVNEVLNYEKGTLTGVSSGDGIQRHTSWDGQIAFPNVSDYGYAVDLTKCTQNMYNYDNEICKENNWMTKQFEGNAAWLLSPYSQNGRYVYHANGTAKMHFRNASFAAQMVPTLHLSSSVNVVDGNGSIENPYRIS